MPYSEGLLQSLEDVLLEWKDLVLQGTGSNRGQWRSRECEGVAVKVYVGGFWQWR